MQIIYKYVISNFDSTELELPQNAVVIDFIEQRSEMCIWVMLDPHAPRVTRYFSIVATGQPIPEELRGGYTATMHVDGYVWHLFEDKSK